MPRAFITAVLCALVLLPGIAAAAPVARAPVAILGLQVANAHGAKVQAHGRGGVVWVEVRAGARTHARIALDGRSRTRLRGSSRARVDGGARGHIRSSRCTTRGVARAHHVRRPAPAIKGGRRATGGPTEESDAAWRRQRGAPRGGGFASAAPPPPRLRRRSPRGNHGAGWDDIAADRGSSRSRRGDVHGGRAHDERGGASRGTAGRVVRTAAGWTAGPSTTTRPGRAAALAAGPPRSTCVSRGRRSAARAPLGDLGRHARRRRTTTVPGTVARPPGRCGERWRAAAPARRPRHGVRRRQMPADDGDATSPPICCFVAHTNSSLSLQFIASPAGHQLPDRPTGYGGGTSASP
jgi:hypothetical protein